MSDHETSEESIYSSDSSTSSSDGETSSQDASLSRSTRSPVRQGAAKTQQYGEQVAAVRSVEDRSTLGEIQGSQESNNLGIAAYARLLASTAKEENATISNQAGELSGSYVGASFWTAAEKAKFLHALALKGQDDLPALSRCVATKSELEVRAYLISLQKAKSDPKRSTSPVHVAPAAFEVSPACEEMLDRAGTGYALGVYNREIEDEKVRFGDYWLIHEDGISDSSSESEDLGDNDKDEPNEPSIPRNLLRESMLLHLSQTIFMNGPPDTGNNWRALSSSDPASSTPALFRSAFEDLHQITTTFTRQIVHASIMQATSRLRANVQGDLAAQVLKRDVQTACAILGLRANWKKYWAHVVRRCGLEVYSDSAKFRVAGRQGTKNGVKVSYDEFEAELGYPRTLPAESGHTQDNTAELELKGVQSEISSTSNTDEDSSATDGDSAIDSVDSDDADDDDEDDDEDLERRDQEMNQAEERRLLQLLNPNAGRMTVNTEPVDSNPLKRPQIDPISSWRKRMRYEAEWEQFPDLPRGEAGEQTLKEA